RMAASPSTSGAARPAPGTLNQLFFDACERHDRPNALQVKVAGAYQPISHRTLLERVRRAALGLRAIGVPRGAKGGLLSEDRAGLTSGITDVPIYPTLPAEQMAYILKDAGVVAMFVSTRAQAEKIAQVRGELPALQHVIAFDGDGLPGCDLSLAGLEARGQA